MAQSCWLILCRSFHHQAYCENKCWDFIYPSIKPIIQCFVQTAYSLESPTRQNLLNQGCFVVFTIYIYTTFQHMAVNNKPILRVHFFSFNLRRDPEVWRKWQSARWSRWLLACVLLAVDFSHVYGRSCYSYYTSITLWWTNILPWKITIFNGKIHYKWPFSIAMLNYQRVLHIYLISSVLFFRHGPGKKMRKIVKQACG